ncbi:MAG: metal ABC transporter solute-binding protein, Zn/Mn family [Rubrivivax sp.]
MKIDDSLNRLRALRRRQLLWAPVLAPMAWTLTLAGGAAQAQPASGRIVASFSILADMVRELAPPGLEVTALVGPDADAHVFKPTPADGRRLAQADLIVVNGLGCAGGIARLGRASGARAPVVVATKGLKPRREAAAGKHSGHSHGHAHDVDPHAWQDLAHAAHYVTRIAEAMTQRWPEHASQIDLRRSDYLARIAALDQRLRERLERIPRAQRRVLISHDAFAYLGAAYGIDFVAPQSWSTHSEPSAKAVAALIRQVRQQQVRAVFVENVTSATLIERIAREGGARVGGTLYSDALSAPDGPAPTYLRMVEHNLSALAQALEVSP